MYGRGAALRPYTKLWSPLKQSKYNFSNCSTQDDVVQRLQIDYDSS